MGMSKGVEVEMAIRKDREGDVFSDRDKRYFDISKVIRDINRSSVPSVNRPFRKLRHYRLICVDTRKRNRLNAIIRGVERGLLLVVV